MTLTQLYVKTLTEQAEFMEAGARSLRTAAELIGRLSCELERANERLAAQGMPPPMNEQPPPTPAPPAPPPQPPALRSTAAAPPQPQPMPVGSRPQSGRVATGLITGCDVRIMALKRGARLTDIINAHTEWLPHAQSLWGSMDGADQRRVKAKREELEALIKERAHRAAAEPDPDDGAYIENMPAGTLDGRALELAL